jgi:membrane protease YdiL (CAAX protease family)
LSRVRLAETDRRLLAFLLLFFLAWTVRATVFYDWADRAIESPVFAALFSNAVKFSLWVIPAAAFAYWVRRANPIHYLGLATNPTARQWAECLVITAAFLAAVAIVDTQLAGKPLHFARLVNYASAAGILALLVSPWIEEVLFRGFLLKEFAARLPAWRANFITSMLFMAVHLPFWLWNFGPVFSVFSDAVSVFIVSIVVGLLYLRTRSVWPPFVAHAANNVLATLLAG